MVKQGDIVLVDFGNVKGSEYGKSRPAVIVQDDIYNDYFNTTVVALITGKIIAEYTTNVFLSKKESGLSRDSMVLCNQVRSIDKCRIKKVVRGLSYMTMDKVKMGLGRVFGMNGKGKF
ncbi:MAG: type II toxin-antitoxin system PemK/MazF family toxin [Nanoarchaeota archaeon]|nr:type II toxin-antitoxin system PemK/MazF family toxin [Nanoarchaeota archaeon]